MKIFIGVPVYNRKEKVEKLAESIQYLKNVDKHSLNIFDDCSTEFDTGYLRKIFPTAHIFRNQTNLGADCNTYNIWKKFLKSEAELLFLCDSDLVLHPDCLSVIEKNICKTDGMLSLLNSSIHPTVAEVDDNLVLKRSVGSAGTVFSRELVKELMDSAVAQYTVMWDWYFCMYLKEHGKRIMATKKSYAIHTGIDGENSNVLLFDYAMDYSCSSRFEKEVLCDLTIQFVEKYFSLTDGQKLKILTRKVVREKARATVARLFGDRRLLDFLSVRKRRFKDKDKR